MNEPETAISLKEAARRLGVAYNTVFHRRQQIGFRLPGCRKWLIWPSRLAELSQPRNNVIRLALADDIKEPSCQSNSATALGGLMYARQAERELDALLARPIGGKRRNTTTA